MPAFKDILKQAASHHGSQKAVLEKAANPYVRNVARVKDDRILSQLTRNVFSAGFSWKVIENKWAGFEEAFERFDPHRVAFYDDEHLSRLVSDERIVRNGQKIKATIDNARFIVDTAKTHGSFGKFLKNWPRDDQAGLLVHLGKHGSRLGGATGQYFLRFVGWDAWIASKDVCAALHREGVLDKPSATSKTALKQVGAAINDLADESGQSRAVISRVLALSTG